MTGRDLPGLAVEALVAALIDDDVHVLAGGVGDPVDPRNRLDDGAHRAILPNRPARRG